MVLDGFELLDLFLLVVLWLLEGVTHLVGELSFFLLHQVHLHLHRLFEVLISEIKNLLQSLLVHVYHLLLVFKELAVLLLLLEHRSVWLLWLEAAIR